MDAQIEEVAWEYLAKEQPGYHLVQEEGKRNSLLVIALPMVWIVAPLPARRQNGGKRTHQESIFGCTSTINDLCHSHLDTFTLIQ